MIQTVVLSLPKHVWIFSLDFTYSCSNPLVSLEPNIPDWWSQWAEILSQGSANRKCEFKASAGRATGLMKVLSSKGSEPCVCARHSERWVWSCGLACMCVGERPGRLTKYTSQQQGPTPLWRLYKWDLSSVTWLSVSSLCLYITQLSQAPRFTKLGMKRMVSSGCHWCPTWRKQTLVCSPSRKSPHSLFSFSDSHVDWQCIIVYLSSLEGDLGCVQCFVIWRKLLHAYTHWGVDVALV